MDSQIDLPVFNALIIDDHQLFAQGFTELLKTMAPEGCTLSHISAAEKAREELQRNNYQFLFTDLLIPGFDTKEFIIHCRKKYPELIIIVVSTILEISKVKECFGIGVNGFLSKAVNNYELKLALEITYNGGTYVSSNLNGRLASSLFIAEQHTLTSKEIEVLRLIAEGCKVEKIADTLFISTYTVMAHRRNIMKKLDLHSAAELVKYAFENKLN